MPEQERLGDGQADYSEGHRQSRPHKPENPERLNLAGVTFQLELKAGHGGNRRRDRTAALRAEPLPWR
jgi:hypothetical protein